MTVPRHRSRPSKALYLACSGLLALAGGVSTAGAAGSRSADGGACPGATVTRQYTAESMTFRLQLDLDGCRWWDGSDRNLMIWLSRDDGSGPASRYAMTPCASDSAPDATPTTVCEVSAALPHTAGEQAVAYQGEATWEWKDGPQRISFDTRCTTGPTGDAHCDDPVDTWHQ
jgi:hypothetical protein